MEQSDLSEPLRDAHVVLEQFEEAWESDSPPDVLDFIARRFPDAGSDLLCDLLEIDIERRWRSPERDNRRDVQQYLSQLSRVLSAHDQARLIAFEYYSRNAFGDCIPRHKLTERHYSLRELLAPLFDEIDHRLPRPVVRVMLAGRVVVDCRLDREVSAGRQRNKSETPWSLRSTPELHRIVLCASADASLSRTQLRVRQVSQDTVTIENSSANRAIAVTAGSPLIPGNSITVSLPVGLHLGGSRELKIFK